MSMARLPSLAVAGLVLAAVLLGTSGLAAALGVGSDSLGAGQATVPRCTSAGLTVTPNLTAGTVSSVTVSGIPASCGAATIAATVNNGAASGSGSATVPGGGGGVTINLAPAPAMTDATQTELVLLGP